MLYRQHRTHFVLSSSVTCFFCIGEQWVLIWTAFPQALLCSSLPNCFMMLKKKKMMMMMNMG